MIKIAIVGVSGYTGLELIKILLNHPKFEIAYIANTQGDTTLTTLHPSLEKVAQYDVQKANANDIAKVAKLCFLALPHKASMGFAKQLLDLKVKVVDLSADYRLKLDTYQKHYCTHEDIPHLQDSVYGLPEIYKQQISQTNLVANPGCYPTATLLGLLPFLSYIQDRSNIFIDAKSGVSGAGKKLSDTTHFVTINENIFAYNPLKHRHSPEINEKIQQISNKQFNINFVPHLISVTRGMLVDIYCTLDQDIDPIKILQEFYKDSYFVRIKQTPPDIKSTAGTNFCDIFATINNNALYISSSIDNLLRGASSQAVVNANIMYQFDEHLGINNIAYVP
jgi:N-acetyl-gamma-glutamyl-phosphate reductase